MSSVNDCIKFDLDIKDKNIVFYNNFYKFFNGVQYKVYEALLKQPTCPFCGFPAEKITYPSIPFRVQTPQSSLETLLKKIQDLEKLHYRTLIAHKKAEDSGPRLFHIPLAPAVRLELTTS